MPRGKPRGLAGLKFNVRMPRAKALDPLEQQKRERQRRLRPQLRSRRRRDASAASSVTLRQQLQALFTDQLHPWWRHLPEEQQTDRHRWRVIRRRVLAWLKRKPQRIGLTVILYLLLCGLPLLSGLPLISLVAVLPLLLVPPVGVLVYWLVWKEFHA
jgi:hypothetical protein